ncbi:MAG: toll/interleukin-1 receptor domain-containing protein [Pirellulales bacterium]
MASDLRLFVSHSAKDAAIAEALIELTQNALNLPASAIRCTSVDGYRLPGGAKTDEQLCKETLAAEAFIGIVSPHSLRSLYVAFELGARWGAKKHLLPVLAPGVDSSVLEGPLAGLNALRSDNRSQLHQMIDDLGKHLGITPASPAAYERYIDRILKLPHDNPATITAPASVVSLSFSAFLKQLEGFDSQTNKLNHLSNNLDLLPDEIPFGQLLLLLGQFPSETNKLNALKTIRARVAQPTEQDIEKLLAQFSSETNKQNAFKIIR